VYVSVLFFRRFGPRYRNGHNAPPLKFFRINECTRPILNFWRENKKREGYSCPIGMSLLADSSCEGRVSLHFTQSGLSIPTAAGVVVEGGSEYILVHTGPRELDGHPLGGCGSGFGLVPGFTTLSVRVRDNI